jgi:hypothetical protein
LIEISERSEKSIRIFYWGFTSQQTGLEMGFEINKKTSLFRSENNYSAKHSY